MVGRRVVAAKVEGSVREEHTAVVAQRRWMADRNCGSRIRRDSEGCVRLRSDVEDDCAPREREGRQEGRHRRVGQVEREGVH